MVKVGYKVAKKYLKHIPAQGIHALNTIGCEHYWMDGLNKKTGDWYRGGWWHSLKTDCDACIDLTDMTWAYVSPNI